MKVSRKTAFKPRDYYYNKIETLTRCYQAIVDYEIEPEDIEKVYGKPKGYLKSMFNKERPLDIEVVVMVADYTHFSMDYLLGYTDVRYEHSWKPGRGRGSDKSYLKEEKKGKIKHE